MANLFGKDCSPNIYGDQNNGCDPNAKGFYLRKNHIFIGDENSLAAQVRLDDTKFEIVDISCNRTQLTLKKQFHRDLLGLDADDHLQYVHISIERTISADHLFTGNPEFNAFPVFSGDPLFSRNPLFTGDPVFTAFPLFSGDPTFSRNPLFSGDPLFTGDPEFQGNTLFTGPATFKDVVKDKTENPGTSGQLLTSTADGIKWDTLGSENVYWVSKSGSDANDGKGELTAKATIKSALAAVKSGYLGKLQDASDLILANKKLIQEEAFGYLMTETDLDSFSFPQEANLDVKAQSARQLIHVNLDSIVSSVISVVSSDPNYNNISGKCERDLRYISRYIADDVLFGGYEGARKSALAYFDIEGVLISSVFTPGEKALMLIALSSLETEINNMLESAQSGYFGSIKSQVSSLIDNISFALDIESLNYFPSEEKEGEFKKQVYYKRFTIAESIWSAISGSFPTLASQNKSYKEEIRNIAIAIAEDISNWGNANLSDSSTYYVTQGTYSDPTAQAAASQMFSLLGDAILSLIDDIESPLEVPDGGYDYIRSMSSSLIDNLVTSINNQSLDDLPEKDNGDRNKSANTCKRDIGYFIDAVASDLKNDGTVHTIEFGESYYDSQGVIYINGEVPQTLLTLNRTRELMVLAIRAWQINGMEDVYVPTYSFRKPYVKKNLIMEPYPPCADVESAINTYYSIAQEILTNGPRTEYKTAREIIFSNIHETIDFAWKETLLEFPFFGSTELTCKRDLGFIIEAIAEDVYKSSNVNMREATQAYFTNAGVPKIDGVVGEEAASVFAFNKLRDYINNVILSDPDSVIDYTDVKLEVTSLVSILTNAITNETLAGLPVENTGTWGVQMPTFKATVIVRSGVYEEDNPLVVPPSTTVRGDDLRAVTVLAKNRVFDVFQVNNGSKIHDITFSNHLYPSYAVAFPQLNGEGVAGIISRSPYIQNCTSKTTTGGGMKVDGDLAQGFRSMVLDSYTQYNQGGVGVEISNSGYAQLVSLFMINCSIGTYANTGGQCDLNNSNASFGDFAMVADGVSRPEFFGQVAEYTRAGKTQVLIKNLGSTKPYNGQVLYFGTMYYELKNIKLKDPGKGYLKAPIIAIEEPDGPLGIPARGRTTIFEGKVDATIVLRTGRNYTTRTPSFTIEAPPAGPDNFSAIIELEMVPIYNVVSTSTEIVDGFATITLNSPITYNLEKGTSVPFFKQSKVLASSITLEYVGSGTNGQKSLPINNGSAIQDNEVDMREGGSVIFTSTDQTGNFRIGDGVIIDQATGTIGGVAFSRGLYAQITPLIIALQ